MLVFCPVEYFTMFELVLYNLPFCQSSSLLALTMSVVNSEIAASPCRVLVLGYSQAYWVNAFMQLASVVGLLALFSVHD